MGDERRRGAPVLWRESGIGDTRIMVIFGVSSLYNKHTDEACMHSTGILILGNQRPSIA